MWPGTSERLWRPFWGAVPSSPAKGVAGQVAAWFRPSSTLAMLKSAMRKTRAAVVAIQSLLLTAQLYASDPRVLSAKIQTILSDSDMARGFWGIEIVSLATGQTLYSQNADKLFIPASNTKLFTTAAALA